MVLPPHARRTFTAWVTLAFCLAEVGCHTFQTLDPLPVEAVPRELAKVSHPPYVIETPDVLQIDALRVIPRPPYRIEPLDTLFIRATGVLQEEPIAGLYVVEPEGRVTLGQAYGAVEVANLTLEQARQTIESNLKKTFKDVKITVSLAQSRGRQQIRGPHLVRPDGTVSLGTYGSTYVANMTVDQAKMQIEAHLSRFLLNPEVSVDVLNYNSKIYYVITDGGGAGEQVYRIPCTGNETVLDAVGQVYGLPAVASKKHIWLARPAPVEVDCSQIFPVDWQAITQGASTRTNYQVLPGDRIYVQSDPLVRTDTRLARAIAPIERIFGIILLGSTTVRSFGPRSNSSNSGF
jgi:protein involved in polysaccharide export with SLBB domain